VPLWGFCLFFSTVLSIAVGVELFSILDLLLFVWFRWFWDLTCDFWAENAKNKYKTKQRQLQERGSGWERLGQRSGFLRCAAHDRAVSSFGRNDDFWGWLWVGWRKSGSRCRANASDFFSTWRQSSRMPTSKGGAHLILDLLLTAA
jgi:hypothetical protein